MLCFLRVESSYREDMSMANKEMCVRALIGKWVVLFSYYFDYPQAFESLLKAESICVGASLEIPRIDVCFAGMYQTIADESCDGSLFTTAMRHYLKAIDVSLTKGDYETADLAFTNIVQLIVVKKVKADIDDVYRRYSLLTRSNLTGVRRSFNEALYASYIAVRGGDGGKAVSILEAAIKDIPDMQQYIRMKVIGYIIRVQAAQGLDACVRKRCLEEAFLFAFRNSVYDALVEILQMMAAEANNEGNCVKERELKLRSLEIKDSLAYHSKCLKVDELRFLHSLKLEQEKTLHANAEKRIREYILLCLVGFTLVVLFFLIILGRKNRRLRNNAETLYRHSVESLGSQVSVHKRSDGEENGGGSVKYVSSNLNEEASLRLSGIIEDYVSVSKEIYSTDFSLARLSEAVGSNPNYVSQTINERFGCNFNTYVNRYRIREACRRFVGDVACQKLTIEAVASEVGFKSRSSFINAFKRETGLTPSEYRKQASRMSSM